MKITIDRFGGVMYSWGTGLVPNPFYEVYMQELRKTDDDDNIEDREERGDG